MQAQHTFVNKRSGKIVDYKQPALPHVPDLTTLNKDEKAMAYAHGKAIHYLKDAFPAPYIYASDVNNPQILQDHFYAGACHMHSITIAHHHMQPIKGATSFIMIASKERHPQIQPPVSDLQTISPTRKAYKLRYVPMPSPSLIEEKEIVTLFPLPVLVSKEFVDGDFTNWHIVPAPFISHFEYKRIYAYSKKFTPKFYSDQARKYYPACTRCHRTLLHQAFAPQQDILPEGETNEGKEALKTIRDHCKKLGMTLHEVIRHVCGNELNYEKIQEFVLSIFKKDEEDTISVATSGNDAW